MKKVAGLIFALIFSGVIAALAGPQNRAGSWQDWGSRAESREVQAQERKGGYFGYDDFGETEEETATDAEAGTRADAGQLRQDLRPARQLDVGDPNDAGEVSEGLQNRYGQEEEGSIAYGGKEASLSGTAGVALLEYQKDQMQTAASNVASTASQQEKMNKTVQRKLSGR
jgi:hypothetical protein